MSEKFLWELVNSFEVKPPLTKPENADKTDMFNKSTISSIREQWNIDPTIPDIAILRGLAIYLDEWVNESWKWDEIFDKYKNPQKLKFLLINYISKINTREDYIAFSKVLKRLSKIIDKKELENINEEAYNKVQ